ncbi:hemolysin-type calcium binding protein [Plesiocystis pacifica SIR-1]|uniref:Hemolysin-type calcium binding protein n=1 Tax=Plesiocystis pacifica SIR-1 TaxID=391625 RepID=A6GH76_9BACT|nr:hypothetical protein [Plesiocystis pacifica]EDM74798.1 hemolysin-type calcium binding protein [Plesiocystis pacifica SIR-1]
MRRTLLALIALSLPLAACDEGLTDDELLAEGETSANAEDDAEAEQGKDENAEAPSEDEETETGEPTTLEGEDCDGDEWTACLEGEGFHFCKGGAYGPCVEDPMCFPGQWEECGGELAGTKMGCLIQDGVPTWDWDTCNTPLALSFDGGPIEMVTSAASFDISGTGSCLGSDWPSADNPWLAIDLDGSGSIEAGSELFGSGSILASGRHAQNGFLALSEYDSDGDGSITPADARFADILVWRDLDSDKRSLPSELSTLADEGVTSISLASEVRETCDARGNCGRERSAFEFQGAGGRPQVGEVVDIYLACH